jgi:hypothetical protein
LEFQPVRSQVAGYRSQGTSEKSQTTGHRAQVAEKPEGRTSRLWRDWEEGRVKDRSLRLREPLARRGRPRCRARKREERKTEGRNGKIKEPHRMIFGKENNALKPKSKYDEYYYRRPYRQAQQESVCHSFMRTSVFQVPVHASFQKAGSSRVIPVSPFLAFSAVLPGSPFGFISGDNNLPSLNPRTPAPLINYNRNRIGIAQGQPLLYSVFPAHGRKMNGLDFRSPGSTAYQTGPGNLRFPASIVDSPLWNGYPQN